MKKSMELYMNAAGWVIGLVGAGYAIGVHCKMNALAKKLDSKEGADEEEATIALLAYENHCYPEAIHVHKEMR